MEAGARHELAVGPELVVTTPVGRRWLCGCSVAVVVVVVVMVGGDGSSSG